MDPTENNDLNEYEPVEDEPLEDEEASAIANSEPEGEDLFNDDMHRDYQANPEQDRYDSEAIDDDVDEEDAVEGMEARRRAEEELDLRDELEGTGRGRKREPAAFRGDDDAERMLEAGLRRRARYAEGSEMGSEDNEEGTYHVDIESIRGKLPDWVREPQVAGELRRRFKRFLRSFADEHGEPIYKKRLEEMIKSNKQSLPVDWTHLTTSEPLLGVWLCDAPRPMMDAFNAAAYDLACEMYPEYEHMYAGVFCRWSGLTMEDSLRDLRIHHIGCMIQVRGVVTRRTGVFPQLSLVKYDCLKCGYVLGPFTQNGQREDKPQSCPNCQAKGPFNLNTLETIYRNYQKLILQESPGQVPAGRLPRQKEVILLNDLIDCARPGEEVQIVGVYESSYDMSLNVKNSFPVFSTTIEANSVRKQEDVYAQERLTDEDKIEILKLSKDPRIGERIVKSIAPSIYGHRNIKTGLALALFGGQEKHPSASHRLRGDINVLLLGDPGTAKSQFLKYVEKTASRAIYTTGKGASAVGLTAGVHKDPITKEWTLEGGALVLADRGVCLIDEFDKMNDQDRVSIHEAMEQQSISISKAGIVTSLQARCSVIAAANPVQGRYDPARTFIENVNLTDPILSRFDVLCVVRDQVDPVQDQRLAEFVVGNHARSHPNQADAMEVDGAADEDPDILSQEQLRKYITYAKQTCRPALQRQDHERIMEVYARLRGEAAKTQGMPVAVRHLESIIRMSEASAKMHLRQYVNDEDITVAIRMMVESFISTQKYSVQRELTRRFRQFLVSKEDFHQLLLELLRGLLREERREEQLRAQSLPNYTAADELRIPCKDLEERAKEYHISDTSSFYNSAMFRSSGFKLDNSRLQITYAMV